MSSTVRTPTNENQREVLYAQRYLSTTATNAFTGHHPVFAKLLERKRVFQGSFGTELVKVQFIPVPGGPSVVGITDPEVLRGAQQVQGIMRTRFYTAEYFTNMKFLKREIAADAPPARRIEYRASMLEVMRRKWYDKFVMDWNADESLASSAGTEDCILSWRVLFNKGGSSATATTHPFPLASQFGGGTAVKGTNTADEDYSSSVHGTKVNSSVTTIGGLDRNSAGLAYLSCPVLNPSSTETFSRDTMNKIIRLGTLNNERPDIVFMDGKRFDILQSLVQAQALYGPSKLAKYGFNSYQFNGVDIAYDDDFPNGSGGSGTGQICAMNTGNLGFYCNGGFIPTVTVNDTITEAPVIEQAWLGYYAIVPTKIGRGIGARHANVQ